MNVSFFYTVYDDTIKNRGSIQQNVPNTFKIYHTMFKTANFIPRSFIFHKNNYNCTKKSIFSAK